MGPAETALGRVLGSVLQLTLQFEQQIQQQQQQQQQHYTDSAAALSNCLAVYDCPLMLTHWIPGAINGHGNLPESGSYIMQQKQLLMQLHSCNLQRVAEAPFCAGSPWPMVCAASARIALKIGFVLSEAMPMLAATRKTMVDWIETQPGFQQFLENFRQVCGRGADLSIAQRMSAADGLVAIGASVAAFMPTLEQLMQGPVVAGNDVPAETHSFGNRNLLALAMVLQELLQFLAAEENSHVLSVPIPVTFLAQRNGLLAHRTSMPASTWRTALAPIAQQCSFHITSTMSSVLEDMPAAPCPRSRTCWPCWLPPPHDRWKLRWQMCRRWRRCGL